MQHPYFKTAKAEQHEEALEKYRVEAVRFLSRGQRPITGRVLEPVETRH